MHNPTDRITHTTAFLTPVVAGTRKYTTIFERKVVSDNNKQDIFCGGGGGEGGGGGLNYFRAHIHRRFRHAHHETRDHLGASIFGALLGSQGRFLSSQK